MKTTIYKIQKHLKVLLAVFLILTIISTVVVATNKDTSATSTITTPVVDNIAQATKLIPQAKPPQGFTEEQIQKAKEIYETETNSFLNNLTKKQSTTNSIQSIQPHGDSMYIIRSPVDYQYTVFKYNVCNSYCYTVYPDLKIPLKTEIWNNNFQPITSNGYASFELYFWNYYSNRWDRITFLQRQTNGNGQVNIGFSLPYKYYSDQYYLIQRSFYWDGSRWQYQDISQFFTVNWR